MSLQAVTRYCATTSSLRGTTRTRQAGRGWATVGDIMEACPKHTRRVHPDRQHRSSGRPDRCVL